jgi:hypothetical protein
MAFDWAHWAAGEPSNEGNLIGEDCVAMNRYGATDGSTKWKRWTSERCIDKHYHFCYIEATTIF